MKKRFAAVAAAFTALVGVTAGSGMAADQLRLHDQTQDQIHDQIQDQSPIHLWLHDGSCK